ncbi:MAG: cyclic nucleotide-binding domain-containing protein [Desulfobacterales bacterium]|nr:cyclic nucleotide-binding domain-containing protein [Desulfobacterales bacterium]
MQPIAELSGNLKFLGLADIMQLLGGNGDSGVLRIHSPYTADTGVVFFINGNPVDAFAGSQTGIDALYALFGWVEGQFEFRTEKCPEEIKIKQGRMEIILDGLRQLDDGEIESLGAKPDKAAETATRDGRTILKGPFVDYMYVVDEESFQDGHELVSQGKYGDWIWVVLEGAVEVIRETPNGPIPIITIGDGTFIGSIQSFLNSSIARNASIKASGKVQVGVLDARKLSTDCGRLSREFKSLIFSLDNRTKCITDCIVDLKTGQNKLQESIQDKKPVIKQGDEEDRLFRVSQGEACIVRETKHGKVVLANLEKDDFFGKIPFLDLGNEPYSAAIYGSADLKTETVDQATMQAAFENLPQTLKNIMECTAVCISATTQSVCNLKNIKKENI